MKARNSRFAALIGSSMLIALAASFVVPAVYNEAQSQTKVVPQSQMELEYSFAPVVRSAAPAVVNIYAKTIVQSGFRSPLFNDPFFKRFFEGFGLGVPGQQQRLQSSLGSGVIVRPTGVIVTNNHVIAGADEITVALSDRREFDAAVILADEQTDLAILKIESRDGDEFPWLRLRDSDDVEVGDVVLALGNPFGVGQTVTSGIISALARTQIGVSDYQSFIQTDAAINPGNSGGALVTLDGQLVGINSAIYSESGGSIGIGFAVPANMVRLVVDGALNSGRIVRPWLGAWGQVVTADLAESVGLDRPGGVLVNEIYEDGPADDAGLRVGDVISSVDGRAVYDPEGLEYQIATKGAPARTAITIWRQGEVRALEVRLVEPPEDPAPDETALDGRHPLSGATVANLSPAYAEELGLENRTRGVIVISMGRSSVAARFGFRPGDIIMAIDREEIESVDDLEAVLGVEQRQWQFTFRRGRDVINSLLGG